jgi:hypothetical protein
MADQPSIVSAVRDLALRGRPVALAEATPAIEFPASTEIADAATTAVGAGQRQGAGRTSADAYDWCRRTFASEVAAPGGGAITKLRVVTCTPGQLMTASTEAVPGEIVVGAHWPLETHYRLGSLLAHEAIHQLLFEREATDSPVRERSLAYSPWRVETRPGRLAWHAFWTFACQIALLAETMVGEPGMAADEPELPRFVARLLPRLPIALDSLERFQVLSAAELDHARRAMDALDDPIARLVRDFELEQTVESEEGTAHDELEAWALATVDAREKAAT